MNAILELRNRFKSQQEMASEIGVEQGTVSDWLNGHKRPSIKNCKLIEQKFGISREKLRPDIFG